LFVKTKIFFKILFMIKGENMKTKLEQKNSNNRTKVMCLELNENFLIRTWGLEGGKFQKSQYMYDFINKGKKNQLTPKEAALADYERIIDKKVKEGYKIVYSESHTNQTEKLFDFTFLPSNFCSSKPYSEINEEKIKNTNVAFTIKYNGICHYILVTPNKLVKIYTRRIEDHTAKYPDIVKAILDCNFPPCTVLATEFAVLDSDSHMKNFKIISEISKLDTLKGKLKPDQSQSYLKQKEHNVNSVIFGCLFYNGEENKRSWEGTYSLLHKHIKQRKSVLLPALCNFKSIQDAKQFLINSKDKFEGFVVWLKEERMEISWNGKPKRRAAYKLKIKKEDDVIAYDWKEGKGNFQGKIGSLYIGKMKDGKIIPLGNVGGLENKDRNPDNWKFPCVIEIKYDNKFPTGKYQFPRFVKVHEDKKPEDCTF